MQVVTALHGRYDANLSAVTSAMLSQKASDASKMADLVQEVAELKYGWGIVAFQANVVLVVCVPSRTALSCIINPALLAAGVRCCC